jgi:hypothetical protein
MPMIPVSCPKNENRQAQASWVVIFMANLLIGGVPGAFWI